MKTLFLQGLGQSNAVFKIFDEHFDLILIMFSISLIVTVIRSIYSSAKQDTHDKEKVLTLKKQGKTILKGYLHFITHDSFWHTTPRFVRGYFYEENDKFVEINGDCFYKTAIRQTDLKTV
jgi:hypothetical protein